MKKLAIFVEGKTERVFVEKLIKQIIDEKRLSISVFQASGGSSGIPRAITLLYKTPDNVDHEFHVQIVESRTDGRVASDVRDYYLSLVKSNFSVIIGIRDVYPDVKSAEIPELRRALMYQVKTVPVKPVLVLGVMEIEAWFLAEYNHFPLIHPSITCSRIIATFHFDPQKDDLQARSCPHDDLHAVYQLEGLAYRKKANHIERTTRVLDYAYVYLEMIERFPDLKTLVETLDGFFTAA